MNVKVSRHVERRPGQQPARRLSGRPSVPRQLPQPSRDSINLVTLLNALADHTRLTLLREMYARGGPADCAAVASDVEVTPPTVSHHFRVLREAGMTTTVVDGRRRIVTIRHEDLEARFPGLLTAVLAPAPETHPTVPG